MARRKLLEDLPIPSTNEEPVLFDTSEIPWWAWIKRFHLPEVSVEHSSLAPKTVPQLVWMKMDVLVVFDALRSPLCQLELDLAASKGSMLLCCRNQAISQPQETQVAAVFF